MRRDREFFRNDKLNANDFFANAAGKNKPPFNQFGGTLGGPVYIPKLYDGTQSHVLLRQYGTRALYTGHHVTGTVPRPEQLAGDSSNLRNAAGNLITIYDPATTQPNPAGGFIRMPFPGNRIPANRIDPIAARLIIYFTSPNTRAIRLRREQLWPHGRKQSTQEHGQLVSITTSHRVTASSHAIRRTTLRSRARRLTAVITPPHHGPARRSSAGSNTDPRC